MLWFCGEEDLLVQLVAKSEMEHQHAAGRHKGNVVESDALLGGLFTSMAVFSFLRGLKRASLFLVFFITLIISSMAKSFSIWRCNKRNSGAALIKIIVSHRLDGGAIC